MKLLDEYRIWVAICVREWNAMNCIKRYTRMQMVDSPAVC